MIGMRFIRRLGFLLGHPAFRSAPFTFLGRSVLFLAHLAARRPLIFPISDGGERVSVPPRTRYTSSVTFLLRDWCEPELRHLDSLIKPGDIFIDVGANIGIFSLRAATLVGPSGRVLAIEPGTEALRALNANLALNPELASRITVINAALSDTDGVAALYHTAGGRDPQAFSLIRHDDGHTAEPVRTTTLDAIVEQYGTEKLNLIKLDVEGAEPSVLAGARKTLAVLRPDWIMEMNCMVQRGDDVGDRTAWDRLSAVGYQFFRMNDDGRVEPLASPPRDFCNVIARKAMPVAKEPDRDDGVQSMPVTESLPSSQPA